MTDQLLSNFERVQTFHAAMGTTRNVWPPDDKLVVFRQDLISEEMREYVDEFYGTDPMGKRQDISSVNKQNVAKELADLLYVVYGAADTFGIDIDRVFEEVHRSNMSKLVDGKPLKRADGKVLKGPNYKPPNLDFVV